MFYLGSPFVITAVTTILPVVHTKKTRHTNNTLKASYFLFIFNQKAGKLCCLIDESLRETHSLAPTEPALIHN